MTKLLVKKSRTLTLSLFEAVYGAMIAAAPAALTGLAGMPVDDKYYYLFVAIGVSKVVLAGVHAYLRFDTHGSVGE